jgi:hypothetical protein
VANEFSAALSEHGQPASQPVGRDQHRKPTGRDRERSTR